MKHFNWNEINSLAVAEVGQYAVYISNGLDATDDEDKILDYALSEVFKLCRGEGEYYDYVGAILSGGLFFFETEEKAWTFYKIFEQELTDSSGIYAAFYDPTGECLTENT